MSISKVLKSQLGISNRTEESDNLPKVLKEMQDIQRKSGALDRILNGTYFKYVTHIRDGLTAHTDKHTNDYDTDGPGHCHEYTDSTPKNKS